MGSQAVENVLIWSNLLFLLPIVRAFRTGYYLRGLLLSVTLAASVLYHTCLLHPSTTTCPLGLAFSSQFDYTMAVNNLPLIALTLGHFGPLLSAQGQLLRAAAYGLDAALVILFLIASAVLIATLRPPPFPSIWPIVILTVAALCVSVLSWLSIWRIRPIRPYLRWIELLIVALLYGMAVAIFLTEDDLVSGTHNWLWLTHSLWHILAALGWYYLLGARASAHHHGLQYSSS